ncbi:hypothetical protein MRX96_029656 [Rhipicephalus microplus]
MAPNTRCRAHTAPDPPHKGSTNVTGVTPYTYGLRVVYATASKATLASWQTRRDACAYRSYARFLRDIVAACPEVKPNAARAMLFLFPTALASCAIFEVEGKANIRNRELKRNDAAFISTPLLAGAAASCFVKAKPSLSQSARKSGTLITAALCSLLPRSCLRLAACAKEITDAPRPTPSASSTRPDSQNRLETHLQWTLRSYAMLDSAGHVRNATRTSQDATHRSQAEVERTCRRNLNCPLDSRFRHGARTSSGGESVKGKKVSPAASAPPPPTSKSKPPRKAASAARREPVKVLTRYKPPDVPRPASQWSVVRRPVRTPLRHHRRLSFTHTGNDADTIRPNVQCVLCVLGATARRRRVILSPAFSTVRLSELRRGYSRGGLGVSAAIPRDNADSFGGAPGVRVVRWNVDGAALDYGERARASGGSRSDELGAGAGIRNATAHMEHHRAGAVLERGGHATRSASVASRNLARQLGLSPRDVTFGLTKVDVRGTLAQALCPYKTGRFAPPCSAQRFRSYDGYCNNLQNPYWGSANLRYLRFLPPNYADGISAVRVDSRGGQLPSARTVSASMFLDQDRPHDHASMMTIAWGKFIFHDIAHTAQSAGFEGSRVKCCNVAAGFEHPECMPIDVPAQDPYYGRFGQRCLEYVRSSAAPRETCGLGPREQNNQVTSFLDGSTIYGSSEAEVKFLRAFEGGQLLSQRTPAGEELPPADLATLDCRREHNRVARSLQGLNPQWDDERTFQEARRIVGAEMQFITYNEFLPALLGPEVVERFGLRLENQGYSQGYDPRRLPGVTNVMAAAGVWAMASAAPAQVELFDPGRFQRLGSLPETAFRPQELYSRLKQIAAGALMQHAQKMDNFISRHVTQDMFASSNREAGVDLAAVAIQQGRDHGLAGYTRWRQFCGLRPIDDFDGLSRVMSSDAAFRLSQLYPTVHDVDLLPAALAETPVEGGLVGPTLACIYAHQFRHLRVSDRFWFENANQPSSFTEDQLRELRKTSLARVLCDNVFFRSGGGVVQPRTMRVPDPWLNNLMSCEDRLLTDVDLDAWQEGSRLLNVPDSVLQDALADLAASQGGQFGRFNSRGGFMRATSGSRSIHNQSEALELATRRLLKAMKKGESKQDVIPALRQVDLSKFATEFEEPAACEEETLGPCDPRTPFRTLSGRCNNLRRPNLGKVGHSFRRVLPGLYEDGVSAPRSRSVTGTALPSPRLVSFAVHGDTSRPHQRYTMMLMQLGQFVDHDIAHTPLAEGPNGETLRCRACDSPRRINKECFPIRIPKNDPHFPSVSRKNPNIPQCLPFTRSMSGQRTLGSREQINQVTGYMDLSTVYGSDDCAREELRLFRGGLLNMSAHPAGVQFKPLLSEVDGAADCISSNGRCFIAGDTRVSEQPGLTSMHTIMSREHNRVARSLQLLNPHWNDDRLFQEARRIVGAMYQRIVYSEFIPRTLGWESVSRWGLNLLDEGYYTGYDPNCDVGSFNEFATAAFRFGHTLLPPGAEVGRPRVRRAGRPQTHRRVLQQSDTVS